MYYVVIENDEDIQHLEAEISELSRLNSSEETRLAQLRENISITESHIDQQDVELSELASTVNQTQSHLKRLTIDLRRCLETVAKDEDGDDLIRSCLDMAMKDQNGDDLLGDCLNMVMKDRVRDGLQNGDDGDNDDPKHLETVIMKLKTLHEQLQGDNAKSDRLKTVLKGILTGIAV